MSDREVDSVPVTGIRGSVQPLASEDKKDHNEAIQMEVQDPIYIDTQGLLKSRLDELSIPQTVWLFRWSAIYAIMAYSMSTIDSWQVSLTLLNSSSGLGECRPGRL